MKTLEFTSEELELLRDLLQHALHEIEIEVFRTDARDFKQLLRHRREVLDQVLLKIGSAPVPS